MNDPLSLGYEVATALASHEESPSSTTALAVAAAIGKTRLFGSVNSGRLTADLACAAADGLDAVLPAWIRNVRKIDPGYLDQWRTEEDEDCIDLLENRVDAWGALVAIREVPDATGAADRVEAAVVKFDRWLQSQAEELSAVVGLPLLANWKALLVSPYRDPLPWWLDGTLEVIAALRTQAALAAMPSATEWRFISVRALLPPLVQVVTTHTKRTFSWLSPCAGDAARLELPDQSTADQDQVVRYVNFERTEPGTPVRLGSVTGIIDSKRRFPVTIGELRESTDLELQVGPAVWEMSQ